MRVNSDSFAPQTALQTAGMSAHSAAVSPAIRAVAGMKTASGMFGARKIMQISVASPPMSTCPSAPRFQKRILNAGVTASAMQSRMATFWASSQMRRLVPNAPVHMVV